jgi:hypothetical protein
MAILDPVKVDIVQIGQAKSRLAAPRIPCGARRAGVPQYRCTVTLAEENQPAAVFEFSVGIDYSADTA